MRVLPDGILFIGVNGHVRKKNKSFIQELVKIDGYALYYADDSLKKDKQTVLDAVKQNGRSLKYADKILREDRNFILKVVKKNHDVFEYIDRSLKKDKKFPFFEILRFLFQNLITALD